MSDTATSPETVADNAPAYRLPVNAFDRVSSGLVAMLVLIGTAVAVLLVFFLFRGEEPVAERFPPTDFRTTSAQSSSQTNDLAAPGQEEVPPSQQPQLKEKLQQLTNVAATAAASHSGDQATTGGDGGTGDPRGPYDRVGPTAGEYDPPKELRYDASSVTDYASMVDYFGGELAVAVPKEGKVYYAKNLASDSPTVREGSALDENKANRFRFMSQGNNPLAQLEVELARKAGIMKSGAFIVVFYPEEFYTALYAMERLEMQRSGHESVDQIERTVIRVNREGSQYVPSVEKQTYF